MKVELTNEEIHIIKQAVQALKVTHKDWFPTSPMGVETKEQTKILTKKFKQIVMDL